MPIHILGNPSIYVDPHQFYSLLSVYSIFRVVFTQPLLWIGSYPFFPSPVWDIFPLFCLLIQIASCGSHGSFHLVKFTVLSAQSDCQPEASYYCLQQLRRSQMLFQLWPLQPPSPRSVTKQGSNST